MHTSALIRVSCLTTTLHSLSLECENTCTPARRVALFCQHFVAPTASAGCVSWMFFSMKSFVQQILINMLFILFKISSHLSCLLLAVSLSILLTPMLICFISQEIALLGMLYGTTAAGPAAGTGAAPRRLLRLRNCRIDPCGANCYDDVHVLCVDFLLQELSHLHWLSALRCHVRADALDLGCLVLDVRGNCFLLIAVPSACTSWTSASVLGCFWTGCNFPL